MNTFFKTIGLIAGIGGLSLGLVVRIFKAVIAKNIFSKLSKIQSYKLLRQIVIFSFILGILGIVAYVILEINNPSKPIKSATEISKDTLVSPRIDIQTHGDNSPGVYSKEDVEINY